MIWDSFFDDASEPGKPPYCIWKSISHEDPAVSIRPGEVLFEGYLNKTEGKQSPMKERYFVLTWDKLYYKKVPAAHQKQTGESLKGYMETTFMRIMTAADEDLQSDDSNSKLLLRFVRNSKYSDLYARNAQELEAWTGHLSQVMVRVDFHLRFKVQSQIGEGSFAKVYLANRNLDGKEFAVKAFAKARLQKQNKGKMAIRNEIEMLLRLAHANVSRLYEVHETKNSLYLVCEYLGGGSLNEYLRKLDDFLPQARVVAIMKYACLTQRPALRPGLPGGPQDRPPRPQAREHPPEERGKRRRPRQLHHLRLRAGHLGRHPLVPLQALRHARLRSPRSRHRRLQRPGLQGRPFLRCLQSRSHPAPAPQ